MRKTAFFLLLLLFNPYAWAQAKLFAETSAYDFGSIEQNVYQINTGFIIANTGDKMLYILRADADVKVKVKVSKRQIEAGDTAYVQLFYFPNANGGFNESIDLISNAQNNKLTLKIKGKIKNYTPDDKQACFNFQAPLKKKKNANIPIAKAIPSQLELEEEERMQAAIIKREKEQQALNQNNKPLAIIVKEKKAIEDTNVSNQNTAKKNKRDSLDKSIEITSNPNSKKPETKVNSEFSSHKSNNLIFLIDISSSMRDSTKLPYLKLALYTLLDNIREQDKVTLITYADSIKILGEAISASLANQLKEKLKPIKAKGLTKGKEAIVFAAKNAVKHYISDGNNEIILASDGEFKFFDENYQQLKNITANKAIKISTIFFGNDFKAQINLRKISFKGNGFFIKINNRQEAKTELLKEIKTHSQLF